MKKKLTAAVVERIKPPAKDKAQYFDQGYPGLELAVNYGGSKTWWLYFRLPGSPKLRHIKLGKYPAMGLTDARVAWRKARESVAQGVDPTGKDSRADTYAKVAEEWLKRDQARNKESTRYQLKRKLDHDLLPAWGARRVDTIKKRDVIELLDAVADRAPIKARRLHAHLGRFFKWCTGRDIITTNPMVGVECPGAESSRDRVLKDAELLAVWNACGEGPYGAAVRLLMLTGARREEISRLKWTEVDGNTISLTGDRTKNGLPSTIALSTPARALLEAMSHDGEYVFSVDGGKHPLTGWSSAKAKIDTAAAIAAWRVHDIRRSVATGLQALGMSLQVVEAVLSHAGGSRSGIVGIYQR
ncbi:MAG: tyrosine-type recombinase/integrase, partial [Methyloceanibacter sp.]